MGGLGVGQLQVGLGIVAWQGHLSSSSCQPHSPADLEASDLPDVAVADHTLVPRESVRWSTFYRRRAAVERGFGRLKNEWALLPLRVRGHRAGPAPRRPDDPRSVGDGAGEGPSGSAGGLATPSQPASPDVQGNRGSERNAKGRTADRSGCAPFGTRRLCAKRAEDGQPGTAPRQSRPCASVSACGAMVVGQPLRP